ncbi:MAG: hypothetical protein GY804_12440 [Alphaproteobacteria bacterium]|nr:hypothetical protein [Alphaproteobacteria bacterium]
MKNHSLRYGTMISAVCACVALSFEANAGGVFFADGVSTSSPASASIMSDVSSQMVYASVPVSSVSVSALEQVEIIPSAYEEDVTPISYLKQEVSKDEDIKFVASAADDVVKDLFVPAEGTSVGGYLPNMVRPSAVLGDTVGDYQVASADHRTKPDMLIDNGNGAAVQLQSEEVSIQEHNLAELKVSASAPPMIKINNQDPKTVEMLKASDVDSKSYDKNEAERYMVKLPEIKQELTGEEFIQAGPSEAWVLSSKVAAGKGRHKADKKSEKVSFKPYLNIPKIQLPRTVSPVVPMELKLNFKRGQTILSQKTLALLRGMAKEVRTKSVVAVEFKAGKGSISQKKRLDMISSIFVGEGVAMKKMHFNYVEDSSYGDSVVVKLLGANTRPQFIESSQWADRISSVSSYYPQITD